jgi:hypothetical protein
MAFFKDSNSIKSVTKDIDAAKANSTRLTARLTAAEDAVVARRREAETLALDGADDRSLDKAEGALRAALDRLSTISAASTEADKLVALLETRLADMRDKQTRAATAAEVEQMATDIEEIGAELVPLMVRLAAVTGRCDAAQIWSSSSLHAFASSCAQQIPDGINLVSQAVREFSIRVLDGRARATLLAPAVPAATAVIETPPVMRVFTTKPVMWTDAQGKRQTCGKYNDADLPPKVAKAALASGVCREIGSDIWRTWSGTKGFGHPDASECEDLDLIADVVVKADPVIVDAKFERLDRGGPYLATVKV